MTKHLRFERWILREEALSSADHVTLHAHLADCAQCRSLAEAWKGVDGALSAVQVVEPPPGFAARWLVRLQTRRRGREIRQAWGALALALGGSAGLLLLLGLAALSSPAAALREGVQVLVDLAIVLNLGLELAAQLFDMLPSPYASVWALGLAFGLAATYAALLLVWAASIFRLVFVSPGRLYSIRPQPGTSDWRPEP